MVVDAPVTAPPGLKVLGYDVKVRDFKDRVVMPT